MSNLYTIFAADKDLIYILLSLSLVDVICNWIRTMINHTWDTNNFIVELWKKFSNLVLIFLTGIIGVVLLKSQIELPFSLVQIFSCLLILIEIENILENISNSELKKLVKKLVDSILDNLKRNVSK